MRIKPWYVQIQQNWAIFLQVYVTHFEYWLLSKFSHLTARQNKYRSSGEIFRIWTRGNNIFFPVKRENNGKTIFIWKSFLRKNGQYSCIPTLKQRWKYHNESFLFLRSQTNLSIVRLTFNSYIFLRSIIISIKHQYQAIFQVLRKVTLLFYRRQ